MLKSAAAVAALLISVVFATASPQARAQISALTVQTTTPASGATVSGTITWDVTVSGGTAARVEFLIDGTLKWTEGWAPFRYNGDTGSLDTRTLSDGAHSLVARAIDAAGVASSATTSIIVANGSPSTLAVTTRTPANNATLSGSVKWEALMTAGTAAQIDFFIDGAQKWTERAGPYFYNGDTGYLNTTTLSNAAHTLMVRATDLAGKTTSHSVTVNVSNSTAAPAPSLNRTIYCFGSPTYGTGGFAYEGTQFGWIRQYPKNLPQRVAFDASVSLMKGIGCDTVKAEVQANDPDPNGGTGAQRAQLYSTDALVAKYGALPSYGAVRGNTKWYAFTFSTNAGYKPQRSTNFPNWNYIMSWHNSGPGGPPNIVIDVASATTSGCGQAFTSLATPRIGIEVNGGNLAQYPLGGATCRRFFGPNFVAGQRYTIAMGIKWADNGTGSAEFWVNGQQVASVANVSTMWTSQTVYPVFENYRPGKTDIGNAITWTNTMYYAGLVAGPTRADVALPGS